MPTDRFKNERGSTDDKKRDDWRFTGDPKEYAKYKDRVAYDLKKLDAGEAGGRYHQCHSGFSSTIRPGRVPASQRKLLGTRAVVSRESEN